jgi:hypothetical protein
MGYLATKGFKTRDITRAPDGCRLGFISPVTPAEPANG